MDFEIIGIRENSEYLEKAIDYFTEKWGMDRRIYEDCMSNSITAKSPLPRWFLMLNNNKIIGSYGLITNDFISRQDLYPWICALYVEENFRGNMLGAKLIEHGRIEAAKLGYKKIYLSTDHNGYYERYGWVHIGNGFHPWGAESRIYEHNTIILSLANKEDFEDILSLQKLAYKSEAEIYGDFSIPPLKQTLDELLKEGEDSIILKYVEDGKIVGSVRAIEKNGTCYIGRLIVHPDYQNKGIGKKLMSEIEKQYSGLRYELFTGHLSNKNLAIYKKLGYHIFKTEKVNDRLSLVYMEK
ncbi:UNVERIFIED_CONTAM: putative acetyltransferase [Acetivibrio alkalicellulosi]